jgi:hypothetical protein
MARDDAVDEVAGVAPRLGEHEMSRTAASALFQRSITRAGSSPLTQFASARRMAGDPVERASAGSKRA